jgi:release factor glutamine methyltransferase
MRNASLMNLLKNNGLSFQEQATLWSLVSDVPWAIANHVVLSQRQTWWLTSKVNAYKEGIPMAYLTGVAHFWSLSLHINPLVLAPRPDSERLVELAIHHLESRTQCLELGTGSGAIALAIASEKPDITITATDLSETILNVARHNAQRCYIHTVQWRCHDWFDNLHDTFDIIVSNPPYLSPHDPHLPTLSAEPLLALVAWPDGLHNLHTLIDQAKYHLNPKGWLLLEHGYLQGYDVRTFYEQHGYQHIHTYQDYHGHDRVTVGQKPL